MTKEQPKTKIMKKLNYLLISVIMFVFTACGGGKNKSESSAEEAVVEETVFEEVHEDEEGGDWEPPGGNMERYMDLKAEGYSHEEAVEIMEKEF